MFDDRTPEKIKAEILAEIDESTGLSSMSGSFADAMAGPTASRLSQFYKALPAVTSMLFVDESSGPYIDLVGETYFNILRRAGTKAECEITLVGDSGTAINAETAFLTASGLKFALKESVTIGASGSAVGKLVAADVGSAYNVAAGEIDRMYVNLVGLASYTNTEASGGTDTESDEALLARIDERRSKPANGANGWQYRQWALSVAGVGEAKVVELANGAGTVGVTIVDSNLEPASAAIVDDCQTYIDSMRPVGASVSVSSAAELPIAVSADVVISQATTAATVQMEFERRLRDYTAELIHGKYEQVYYSPNDDMAYTLIYNRVLALLLTIDGVVNANTLKVNGGTADISIPAMSVPLLGEVVVTA